MILQKSEVIMAGKTQPRTLYAYSLKQSGESVRNAAKLAGVSRKTLQAYIARLKLFKNNLWFAKNTLNITEYVIYYSHRLSKCRHQRREKMYEIREKMAYSKIGKLIATLARNAFYKNARVHWVQQAFADWNLRNLATN